VRLKYEETLEWLESAREQEPGLWLVSGVRTAKTPSGPRDQQYACRVSVRDREATLKLIQIFKEASRTGKDIFEVH
jgi:hypothetical protein